MKISIAIIIVIGVVVFCLGIKAIDSWTYAKNLETMLRYGNENWDFNKCEIDSNNKVWCE